MNATTFPLTEMTVETLEHSLILLFSEDGEEAALYQHGRLVTFGDADDFEDHCFYEAQASCCDLSFYVGWGEGCEWPHSIQDLQSMTEFDMEEMQ